jgi:spermidine/putrescine-binding protein
MSMKKFRCRRGSLGLMTAVVLALFLAACGMPPATPNPIEATVSAPAEEPTGLPQSGTPAAEAPFVSRPSGQQTASGFGCPAPQPKLPVTSTELNLFVWSEYIPQDMLDCFELVYGMTINRSEYSSNEEMYAKLAQGSSQFDLAQPSDYIIAVMVRTGLLDQLDKSRLPNLKNLAPALAHVPGDPNGQYIVPYQAGTESLVYNADTIKTPPQSWKDLWNAEYADRMVFVDDPRYVIGAVLLTEGKDPNTTNPADLAAIKPKLAELIANVRLFDSDSPKSALIAGDVDLGYVYNGEAFLAAQENPAFTYVYPTEGTFLWQDGFGLVQEAPHPDAAYAWLNYMLQPDVFWLMLRDFPYTNPNQAALEYARNATFKVKDADGNEVSPAELYEAYMKSNITNPPAEIWQNGINIKDVGDALPLYDNLWTEVKSGP